MMKLAIRLIIMVVLELMVVPLLPLAILLSKTDLNPKPNKTVKKNPVLLLHGSSFNQGQWLIMRMFLKLHGHSHVYTMNMDDNLFKSVLGIEDYGERVNNKIKDIVKDAGGDYRVDLVGHSLGGLVAGYVKTYLDKDNHVRKVISVATPWCGSRLIPEYNKYRDLSKSQEQMKPGSEMTTNIYSRILHMEKNREVGFYNIGSASDIIVPGTSCSIISTVQENCYRSVYAGHYGIIRFPNIMCKIARWLDI